MFSIFKKEFRAFFSSAIGYLVVSIFLLLTNLLLWVIPGTYNIIDSGYANVDGLFYLAPWLFLFLCPAVSMRLFAEEKLSGTWELLVTKPISKINIVLAKFLAAWVLVLIALAPTAVNYFSVYYLAEPIGNLDSASFWGSYIGLMFLSLVYVAIGTFTSTCTKNQIVAFVVSLVLCFVWYYGFDVLSQFFSYKNAELIQNIGINAHYKSMSRGVLDSRDMMYFLVLSAFFLFLSVYNIRSKK